MKVGSLFTGYGGLDLAVGGELAWYAEIEPAACKVLAAHYPGVPNLGDITRINWAEVEPVDILTGGYPCQPFSHAGQRKGKNDERHLWPYVLDAIRGIRPRYAILENVSGHLTLGFDIVLTDLAQIGWSAEWGTFRASDIGAPHRRERLFIIAYAARGIGGARAGWGVSESQGATGLAARESTTPWWFEQSENRDWELERGHSSRVAPSADTSGERHGRGQRPRGMEGMGSQTESSGWQASTTRQEFGTGSTLTTADTKHHGLNGGEVTRGVGQSQDQGWMQQPERRDSEMAADTDNGHGQAIGGVQGLRGRHVARGDMQQMQPVHWGKYTPAITRWESVLGRPAPAPTVERKDKRRLNPEFVEWMMGLTDGWVTGHGLSAAQELKMLGNGVVPQQAHAAITQLMERVQSWASSKT